MKDKIKEPDFYNINAITFDDYKTACWLLSESWEPSNEGWWHPVIFLVEPVCFEHAVRIQKDYKILGGVLR